MRRALARLALWLAYRFAELADSLDPKKTINAQSAVTFFIGENDIDAEFDDGSVPAQMPLTEQSLRLMHRPDDVRATTLQVAKPLAGSVEARMRAARGEE